MPQPAVTDWRTGLKVMAATLAVRARVGMLGRGVRLGPWIPLAQAESARLSPVGDVISPVAEGRPLTSADIAEIARLYDPRIHRAAIVSYEGPGNPHLMAEGYPADGWIERVVATPTHLWGRSVEIIDEDGESRVVKRIRAGYTRRSVYIQEDRQDITGPYLRHVLLASGHAEGQGGNPPMTWFFPQALKLESSSAERLSLADSGGLARIAYDVEPAALAAEEEPGMSPEEMLGKFEQMMQGMSAAVEEMKSELTVKIDAAKTAADAAVTEQTARIATLETTIKANEAKEVERTYRSRLTVLAGEKRITAEELEDELKDYALLPSERVEARLSSLAKRVAPPASPILNLPDKLVLTRAAKPSRSRISSAGLELIEELAPAEITMDTLRDMDKLEARHKGVAA